MFNFLVLIKSLTFSIDDIKERINWFEIPGKNGAW